MVPTSQHHGPSTSQPTQIACDGIWDVKTSAEVCNFLRRRLLRQHLGLPAGTGFQVPATGGKPMIHRGCHKIHFRIRGENFRSQTRPLPILFIFRPFITGVMITPHFVTRTPCKHPKTPEFGDLVPCETTAGGLEAHFWYFPGGWWT